MPIARFELPDGRIGRFEVPEGTTPDQAMQLISSNLQDLLPKETPTNEKAPSVPDQQLVKVPAQPTQEAPEPSLGNPMGDDFASAIAYVQKPEYQSVLSGVQLPQENLQGLNPKFVASMQKNLDAMDPDKRQQTIDRLTQQENTVGGRAAKIIADRYKAMDLQPEKAKFATDSRVETQTNRFIDQGANPETARTLAQVQAERGVMRPDLQQLTPDIVGEQADKAVQEQAKQLEGAGFLTRVGAEAKSQLAQTGMGLMQNYADLIGDTQMSKDLMGAQRVESEKGANVPTGPSLFEKSAQHAIATLATQAPVMAIGTITGTAAPMLAFAGVQQYGQAYGEGRQAGLDPVAASARAGLQAAAEVMFEQFGMPKSLAGLKTLFKEAPNKKPVTANDVAAYFMNAIAHELPTELATTATQYGIDILPGIGTNKNPSLAGLYEQLAETLRQTIIQSGATAGAAIGATKGTQAAQRQLEKTEFGRNLAVANAIKQDVANAEFTQEGINKDVVARLNPNSYAYAKFAPEEVQRPPLTAANIEKQEAAEKVLQEPKEGDVAPPSDSQDTQAMLDELNGKKIPKQEVKEEAPAEEQKSEFDTKLEQIQLKADRSKLAEESNLIRKKDESKGKSTDDNPLHVAISSLINPLARSKEAIQQAYNFGIENNRPDIVRVAKSMGATEKPEVKTEAPKLEKTNLPLLTEPSKTEPTIQVTDGHPVSSGGKLYGYLPVSTLIAPENIDRTMKVLGSPSKEALINRDIPLIQQRGNLLSNWEVNEILGQKAEPKALEVKPQIGVSESAITPLPVLEEISKTAVGAINTANGYVQRLAEALPTAKDPDAHQNAIEKLNNASNAINEKGQIVAEESSRKNKKTPGEQNRAIQAAQKELNKALIEHDKAVKEARKLLGDIKKKEPKPQVRKVRPAIEELPYPKTQEQMDLEERYKDLEAARRKKARLEEKGGLFGALRKSLSLSEIKNISPEKHFLQLKSPNDEGRLVDIVSGSAIEDYLPHEMRYKSPTFDPQQSEQYIIEKLQSGNYMTYDAEQEIERLTGDIDYIEGNIKELEDLVKEQLELKDVNLLIEEAADEQRRADQANQVYEPEHEAGVSEPGKNELALKSETPDEVRAKERAKEERAKAEKEAEQKAEADKGVGEFTLTGSNRPADIAAARGQTGLFENISKVTNLEDFREDKEDQEIMDWLDNTRARQYFDEIQTLLPRAIDGINDYAFVSQLYKELPGIVNYDESHTNTHAMYAMDNYVDEQTQQLADAVEKYKSSTTNREYSENGYHLLQLLKSLQSYADMVNDMRYDINLAKQKLPELNMRSSRDRKIKQGVESVVRRLASVTPLKVVSNISPDIGGPAFEVEQKRSPSFKRAVTALNKARDAGMLTDEEFAIRVAAELEADDFRKSNQLLKARQRGILHIKARLNYEANRGNISKEGVDLAEWFMNQNPSLVDDLAISIVKPGEANVAGHYNDLLRLIALIKKHAEDGTVLHEILHHLERMLPPDIQDAIRKEWLNQILAASKKAKTPVEKVFFKALLDAHFGNNKADALNLTPEEKKIYEQYARKNELGRPTGSSYDLAIDILKNSALPYDLYQYANPSEFWAVNATDIVAGRFNAIQKDKNSKIKISTLKEWLKNFAEKIKGLFGLNSSAPLLKALDSLQKSDGTFKSKEMLGSKDYLNIVQGQMFPHPPPPKKNIYGRPATKSSWELEPETKIGHLIDTIEHSIVDKHVDTRKVQQAIQKNIGLIEDAFDVYMKEELYHGRTAKALTDFLRNDLNPVIKDLVEDGITIPEIEEYLHNRHAEERNNAIARINDRFSDVEKNPGSGISTSDARKYLANLDKTKKAQLEKVAAKIDAIIQDTQKILVKNGLETQDVIDNWNGAYKHYVPLMRDQEELDFKHHGSGLGRGFQTKGKSSKRAYGSTKEVVDILANIAMQREAAIIRSEKARIGRALYGLALKNPNPDFWLPVNPDAIKDKNALYRELISMGLPVSVAQNFIQEPTTPSIDPVTGKVIYRINSSLRDSDNVFPVRINGKDRFVFFNTKDPKAMRMVSALSNLDPQTLGGVLGTSAMITRWIASVNTQYNPVFGAINFARDVQGAMFNLTNTPLAGKQKEVLQHVFPAMFAIIGNERAARKNKALTTYWSNMYDRMQKAGGTTGFREAFARGKFSGKDTTIIERELAKETQGAAMRRARYVFDMLSDYNDGMENAVRLSVFKVALDNGFSEERAASIAKNITINFNRKGQNTPYMQALFAFFNAAVQGTVKVGQVMSGPAGRKIMAGGFIIGAIQAIALAAMGFDNDEPPDYVKDKNFIIPKPDGTYYMFPMPPGYNVFPGVARILTEYILGQNHLLSGAKPASQTIGQVMTLIGDAFNPLGSGSFLQQVTPTPLDPVAAVYTNKDAFGRPIYKEDMATKPTPGFMRSRENATAVSQAIAHFLNDISSPAGTKFTKGNISPTADELDYYAGQLGGGAVREVIKAAETLKAPFTGEPLPSYRIPLVGRFYGDTKSQAAIQDKFYNNVTLMNKYANEIKNIEDSGQDPSKFIKQNPASQLADSVGDYYNAVNQMNAERKEMMQAKLPMSEIRKLEAAKAQTMKDFNDQVAQIQKRR